MNKKLLFSIIAVAFVGSLFTVAYAGPAFTTITLAGTVDMVSNQIKNLQDPTDPQDAVTKSYVDNLFACEGGSEMCSVGIGECESAGINLCIDGVAQCGVTPGTPVTEICDFLDNDCDGSIDEGGVCTGTETNCSDGIDNDSDGLIDCADDDCNGLTCDVGLICQSNTCSLPSFNTCAQYCDLVEQNCVGGEQIFADITECLNVCPNFDTSGATGDTSGNTLQCRTSFAELAGTLPVTHCPHASPDSPLCVECFSDSECAGGTPICNQFGTCSECSTDADCLAGEFCTTASGVPPPPGTPIETFCNSVIPP